MKSNKIALLSPKYRVVKHQFFLLHPQFEIVLLRCTFEVTKIQHMILKILFVIAIVLQFFAVAVALRLTRVTKYNFSWMLLTIGFILMAVMRLVEFLPYVSNIKPQDYREIFVWGGVITSLAFAIGVFMIQKIFKYMKRVEDSRRLTEKMFLNTIIQTEEKERKRFAKDLHDGLGPLAFERKNVGFVVGADEARRSIARNCREYRTGYKRSH
jgi:signal transduction histidine kinase